MWLFCCGAGPAASLSFVNAASVRYTVPSDYELQAQSPVISRDFSLEDILRSALTRRRRMYSDDMESTPSLRANAARNTGAFMQQMGSQHSMGSLLLSSWCAQQFQAFKSLWVQAATTNKLPCTETGLTVHEMYLMQYLKQGSAVSRWGSSAACLGLKAARDSHDSSHSQGSGYTPRHRLSQRDSLSAASAPAHAGGSSNSDGRSPEDNWTEWLIFAEPPDCPVASSLQWAAAAGCSSHDTGRGASGDSHAS